MCAQWKVVNVALTDSCMLFLDRIMLHGRMLLFPLTSFPSLFTHFEYNTEKNFFLGKGEGKIRCEIDTVTHTSDMILLSMRIPDWSFPRECMNFIGSFKSDRLPVVGSASMVNVWSNWKSCKDTREWRIKMKVMTLGNAGLEL